MKPPENIEKLIKNIDIDTNARMDKAVLDDALKALENSKKKGPAVSLPNIWRTIMKSKITKPATAAAGVAFTIVVVWWLLAGPVMIQSAYAELVEAIENSTNPDWVHAVIAKYDGLEKNGTWTWVEANDSEQEEIWFSLQPFQQFRMLGNGHINFVDYANRRSYGYNPESRIMTIDYENAPDLVVELNIQSLRDALALSAPKDDEVIKRQERINGKNFTVFYKEVSGEGYEQWVVDPETKLVTKNEEVDYEDKEKKIIIYNYPEIGPVDIYALGVPRDVKIVNLAPPREIEELVDNARAAEKKFSNMFFAIECKLLESFEGSIPLVRQPSGSMPFQEDTRLYDVDIRTEPVAVITVTYRKDDNGRREIYPVWVSEYTGPENYQERLEEVKRIIPTENIEALEAWIQSRLPSQVIIFNKRDMFVFQLERDGTLTKLSKSYDPRDRAALLNINFWRPPNNRYDLDHYYEPLANQDGQWGELVGIAVGDEEYQCYFNPARDYICERISSASTAPEQWRGYTKNVLEYAKTFSGRWYPRETRSVWDKATYLFANYVDDNCVIDDELFDGNIISASDLVLLDME